jgi:hypothetical protein
MSALKHRQPRIINQQLKTVAETMQNTNNSTENHQSTKTVVETMQSTNNSTDNTFQEAGSTQSMGGCDGPGGGGRVVHLLIPLSLASTFKKEVLDCIQEGMHEVGGLHMLHIDQLHALTTPTNTKRGTGSDQDVGGGFSAAAAGHASKLEGMQLICPICMLEMPRKERINYDLAWGGAIRSNSPIQATMDVTPMLLGCGHVFCGECLNKPSPCARSCAICKVKIISKSKVFI